MRLRIHTRVPGCLRTQACYRSQRSNRPSLVGSHTDLRSLSVVVLLVIHALLLGWSGILHSPALDEVGHLPAGVYVWTFGRFDVYRVNPPLVRTIAALPVMAMRPRTDWSAYRCGMTERPEWDLGRRFVEANGGERAFWYFALARWACIPFCLVGGYVCWRWANELYGASAALVSLSLWCFSPNILAWGSTLCPDAAAAAMGAAACYVFWRWLHRPTWARAAIAGIALGLAELTKTTWIVLFACYPVLWLVGHWSEIPDLIVGRSRQIAQLASILLVALLTINVGYGFEGSFTRLGDYQFVSGTLAGEDSVTKGVHGGNRFRNGILNNVTVPVPENYLRGIDLQKSDFEKGKWSYLCGEWKFGGWWYYYLICALLKAPLGTWILGLLAVGLTLARRKGRREPARGAPCAAAGPGYSAGWRNELALLLPAMAVFVLVTSQTGFSRYFRYVLPCFPFALIWISKAARSADLKDWRVAAIAGPALLWSIASSLSVYPHSMSYFNELAGGPSNGHRYLIHANIDWGQDLHYLKRWLDEHPDARPLHLDCYGFLQAEHFGIETLGPPPPGPIGDVPRTVLKDGGDELGPKPGWHAISVHQIHDRSGRYQYFFRFRPTAMAGYSIYIYHITLEEANRVRGELGLPMLAASEQHETGKPPTQARVRR